MPFGIPGFDAGTTLGPDPSPIGVGGGLFDQLIGGIPGIVDALQPIFAPPPEIGRGGTGPGVFGPGPFDQLLRQLIQGGGGNGVGTQVLSCPPGIMSDPAAALRPRPRNHVIFQCADGRQHHYARLIPPPLRLWKVAGRRRPGRHHHHGRVRHHHHP